VTYTAQTLSGFAVTVASKEGGDPDDDDDDDDDDDACDPSPPHPAIAATRPKHAIPKAGDRRMLIRVSLRSSAP